MWLDMIVKIVVLALVPCVMSAVPFSSTMSPTWFPEQCRVASNRTTCASKSFRINCPQYCVYDCPAPFILDDKDCFAVSVTAVTWYEAAVFCKSYGGYLAPASDQGRDLRISSLILNDSPSSSRWSGGSATQSGQGSSSFQWYYGEDNNSYRRWASGQPDLPEGSNCLVHSGADSKKAWDDVACSDSNFFTCYTPADVIFEVA